MNLHRSLERLILLRVPRPAPNDSPARALHRHHRCTPTALERSTPIPTPLLPPARVAAQTLLLPQLHAATQITANPTHPRSVPPAQNPATATSTREQPHSAHAPTRNSTVTTAASSRSSAPSRLNRCHAHSPPLPPSAALPNPLPPTLPQPLLLLNAHRGDHQGGHPAVLCGKTAGRCGSLNAPLRGVRFLHPLTRLSREIPNLVKQTKALPLYTRSKIHRRCVLQKRELMCEFPASEDRGTKQTF